MRIISGRYKSKRILAPKNLPVRPTTDMAKEALFNILNNRYYFADISIIDLFAGTGNISYEFASRGTEHITAVDADSGCIRFIDRISKEMDLGITTFKKDVFDYLEKSTAQADIIFADPFYNMAEEDFEKVVRLVFQRNLLLENGTLIIEHTSRIDLSPLDHFSEKRKYGGSAFSFFNKT
ncbi:16S rRNA (guanine(966)-N(2))-methyltransferase RsmD [Pricia antarctica]|uniref:16S rRNA (Guanine(966)-N(2))-methyltransferase RsmD n=1 Tax=Pricia antarctica TaxID=641691 RepID=A0A1G7FUC9_9FLAO|nr:RsmD family RNA methyltransferase [Pricia antarctica]SDE79488.1 16S rRNA (guanine(966)-N(2))-methyltransferase RsmD [Pricia antarctica]